MPVGSPANSQVTVQQLSRVAQLTLGFWLLKFITTTVGDLSGDLLSTTLGLGYLYSLVLSAVLLATMLAYQFSIKRSHLASYWALVLISATFGAELSDALGRGLDLGNSLVTLILWICWAVTLILWYLGTGKIRASKVRNRKDELFYWMAVIAANSLGSVLGDLLGDQFGIGLAGRIGVCMGILAFLWILRMSTRLDQALLFWIAFVFSRIWF